MAIVPDYCRWIAPGSVVKRIEATATTAVPASVAAGVFAYIFSIWIPPRAWAGQFDLSPPVADLLGMACSLAVPILATVLDAMRSRATYGMRYHGLRFGDSSGIIISAPRCALRILVGIGLSPLAPVSLILMMLDEKHRSLPDRICGTVIWFSGPSRDMSLNQSSW